MLMKNKKGFDFLGNWPYYFFMILFVATIITIVFAKNIIFTYFFIIISGIGIGRFFWQKRTQYTAPFVVVAFGFVAGLIMSLIATGRIDWRIGLIVFLFSSAAGYFISSEQFFGD